ncbi:macro domain-containing protein [Bacillus sp. AFS076308]
MEDIKIITFCAISTGVFGFPKQETAHIAVKTIKSMAAKSPKYI